MIVQSFLIYGMVIALAFIVAILCGQSSSTRRRLDTLEGLMMPKGSKVHKVFEGLRKSGASKGKAARIAQSTTGQALATGKPPKLDKGTSHRTSHRPRKT